MKTAITFNLNDCMVIMQLSSPEVILDKDILKEAKKVAENSMSDVFTVEQKTWEHLKSCCQSLDVAYFVAKVKVDNMIIVPNRQGVRLDVDFSKISRLTSEATSKMAVTLTLQELIQRYMDIVFDL